MEDGAFVVPTGPGLGVEVDEDKLAEYRDGVLEHHQGDGAMRFGFARQRHYQRHVELVQRAERLDPTPRGSPTRRSTATCMDPRALATSTERIGLGLGATNPFTRHPAMTSCAIASSRKWRRAASRSRSALAT